MNTQNSEGASNYRLFKPLLEQTPISSTFNIQNLTTEQVWRSKVYTLQKVSQYGMESVLQYNEQVFQYLKNKYQNSLHLECVFQKKGKQYLVFQLWQDRLSTYILNNQKGLPDKIEVKDILEDVLMSICDIYAEDFMILNLRPEHIVKVKQLNSGLQRWRIQSVVFQYKTYNLPQKCQYEFDYAWASNEQKQHRENLEQKHKDQQIVWYLGILALRLIYGPNFKLNQKFKDSDINLSDLKQRCTPQVFDLVVKSVRANRKDRIPLKEFFMLTVFDKVQIGNDIKQKFISGNSQRMKKSQIRKSQVLKKSSIRRNNLIKLTASRMQKSQAKSNATKNANNKCTDYRGKISQLQASRTYQQLRWALQKLLYLAEIKYYTQSNASTQQMNNQDKVLIRYLYLKIAEVNLKYFIQQLKQGQVFKSFRQSQNFKDLYNRLHADIQENGKSQQKSIFKQAASYQLKMMKLDPNNLRLLKACKGVAAQLKSDILASKVSVQKLVNCLKTASGSFYSCLKTNLDNHQPKQVQNRSIKKRSLCYMIFSVYVVVVTPCHGSQSNALTQLLQNDFRVYQEKFLEQQKIKGSVHVKFADQVEFIKLSLYTLTATEQVLIQHSQDILKKYFRTPQAN